jgi:formylglycine-generating enzyme required for sulfatase activity
VTRAPASLKTGTSIPEDAVVIPAGRFLIGSDSFYPEERSSRWVGLSWFAIDRTPITNAQFAVFVRETGWVTDCEKADPGGSAVFRMTSGPVDLRDPRHWWAFVEGASWRHPQGPGSSLNGLEFHPVVHVSYHDALAFAQWRGGRLPTEAEWEVAARGGLIDCDYAWGNEVMPGDRLLANIWVGSFPWYHAASDLPGPTAVSSYPPNGYGLFDMIGNVWEWTATAFAASGPEPLEALGDCGCGGSEREKQSSQQNPERLLEQTLKGGSYLCAAEYCARYRPAARIGLPTQTSTSHVGFRCAYDLA